MKETSSTTTARQPDHPIRARRQAAGLTIRQLAERSGVSTRSIAAYEIENVDPGLSVAKRIALVLGCSVDDLTGREADEVAVA